MCQSTCIIHNFVAFEHAYLYLFYFCLLMYFLKICCELDEAGNYFYIYPIQAYQETCCSSDMCNPMAHDPHVHIVITYG